MFYYTMRVNLNPTISLSTNLRKRIKSCIVGDLTNVNLSKTTEAFFHTESASPYTILSKLTNWLSKEDLIEISKLEENYKKLEKSHLIFLRDSILSNYIHRFQNLDLETLDKDHISTTLVDEETQYSLKQDFLKIFALNNSIQSTSKKSTKVPLSYWFETDLGMQKSFNEPNAYIHPEDKALLAFGGYLKEDVKRIEKYQNRLKKYDNQILLLEKINILEKLIRIQNGNSIYFEGSFSKKELKKMKILACKYRALNNILKSRGIFSKNIESILFAPDIPTSIQKGDYIGGLGYVVNRIKMDNEDFTIIFSETNKNYSFNLYKTSEINKKDKLLDMLPNEINLEEINKLDELAKNLIREKTENISQIRFQVLNNEQKQAFKTNNVIEDTSLDEIFDNEDTCFYVNNFINNYPKKYGKAGKIIGIQLLKFLKERDCTPIFLTARAYNGSTHSPVSLYLRAGFKPLSHTASELQEKMAKNMSRYPDNEKINFYLDNFNNNGELIDSLTKIYGLD